jgi:hypothetical protein
MEVFLKKEPGSIGLPGTEECKKISILLKRHPVFYTSLFLNKSCEIHLTEFIKSNTIFLGSNLMPILLFRAKAHFLDAGKKKSISGRWVKTVSL